MKSNEFKTYHPIVNFTYFVFVICFSMFFMNPVCLIISFFSAFLYMLVLKGKTHTKKTILYMLPVIIIMGAINPLFNHEGMTVLTYFPNGNPLTLESVIYGFCAAFMLLSVLCFFSCYNEVMTSDKFIYLFGKIIPSLSLIISMTLRFVPKFLSQFKVVADANKCMGKDVKSGKLTDRMKNALSILSIMVTWSLENAVDTADSMKARGYSLEGRTAFSVFRFDARDKKTFAFLMICGIYVLTGAITGAIGFDYFPVLSAAKSGLYQLSIYFVYFILCIVPLIIECTEVIKWKYLKSKI